jgi:hypothetical protein
MTGRPHRGAGAMLIGPPDHRLIEGRASASLPPQPWCLLPQTHARTAFAAPQVAHTQQCGLLALTHPLRRAGRNQRVRRDAIPTRHRTGSAGSDALPAQPRTAPGIRERPCADRVDGGWGVTSTRANPAIPVLRRRLDEIAWRRGEDKGPASDGTSRGGARRASSPLSRQGMGAHGLVRFASARTSAAMQTGEEGPFSQYDARVARRGLILGLLPSDWRVWRDATPARRAAAGHELANTPPVRSQPCRGRRSAQKRSGRKRVGRNVHAAGARLYHAPPSRGPHRVAFGPSQPRA